MNFTEDDRYKYPVLGMIQDIHTFLTGSDDSWYWGYDNRDDTIQWLQWRLTTGWLESKMFPEYDNSVRDLGFQVLRDYHSNKG